MDWLVNLRLVELRSVELRLVILIGILLLAPGCGGAGPPPEGQIAIENVARWYQSYRINNRGKPPADEKEFVDYINGRLKAQEDDTDVDQILTSPRDGKKYVVRYGKPNSNSPDRNVAVHEQEGYGGKKLLAYEVVYAKEVDDAQLQAILSQE